MTPAPKGRWFRFSLRTLLAVTAAGAVAVWLALPNDVRAIQGRWYGTGRDARFSLTFRGKTLVGKVGTDPIVPPMTCTFQLAPREGHIDIFRDDGVQRGLYLLEGDKLTMMLADVNLPRPSSLDFPGVKPAKTPIVIERKTWKPATQSRYVFERR